MPWFPDFTNAAELARRWLRVDGHADPGAAYLTALERRDTRDLEVIWPGEVVVHDPVAGEVRGHRALRQFVHRSGRWLDERRAQTERIACTVADGRAVLELLAHLDDDGRRVTWPVAVVAEADGDRSVVFRTYCSRRPVDGRHHIRPPVLAGGNDPPGGAVGRLLAALAVGDADAVVAEFAPEAYVREPDASDHTRLPAYFARCFSGGGSVVLRDCATTDDGARCALEYTCVRWGDRDLPPEAGLMVCERDARDRLAAVRLYDDIERPARVESAS